MKSREIDKTMNVVFIKEKDFIVWNPREFHSEFLEAFAKLSQIRTHRGFVKWVDERHLGGGFECSD